MIILADEYREAKRWLDNNKNFSLSRVRIVTDTQDLRGYRGQRFVIVGLPRGNQDYLRVFVNDNFQLDAAFPGELTEGEK